MFGTLRLDPSDAGPIFVERANGAAFSALGNTVPQHTACDQCRQKKLRCTGRKSGCHRCRTNSIDCTYTQILPGNGRRPEGKRPASRHYQSRSRSASIPSASPSPSLEQTEEPDTNAHEIIVVASSEQFKPPPVTAAGDNSVPDSSKAAPATPSLGQDSGTNFPEEQHQFDGLNGGSHTWDAELSSFNMDTAMITGAGFDRDSSTSLAAFDWSPHDPALASTPRPALNVQLDGSYTHAFVDTSTFTAPIFRATTNRASTSSVSEGSTTCTSQCPQLMKSLLEEVDECLHDTGPCQVDAALSCQKRTCMQCSRVISCKSCYVDPDCMMFLTMICDKLVMLNKKILWYTMEGATVQRPLFAGEYEMDQLDEWGGMVQHLCGVQLKKIKMLVEKIEASPGIEGKLAQGVMLRSVKNQVAVLLGRIKEALTKDVEVGEG